MAIKVGVSGVTVKKVAITGQNTIVKTVVVGKPTQRVGAGAFITHLEDLYDVDTTVVQNGSILVYDSDSSLWTATFTLDGGTF
jgi:hypothetical protein